MFSLVRLAVMFVIIHNYFATRKGNVGGCGGGSGCGGGGDGRLYY